MEKCFTWWDGIRWNKMMGWRWLLKQKHARLRKQGETGGGGGAQLLWQIREGFRLPSVIGSPTGVPSKEVLNTSLEYFHIEIGHDFVRSEVRLCYIHETCKAAACIYLACYLIHYVTRGSPSDMNPIFSLTRFATLPRQYLRCRAPSPASCRSRPHS